MDSATYLLFLLLLLLCCILSHGSVTVNLSSRGVSKLGDPLKYVALCVNCPNPELEGSVIKGLVAKHGVQDFDFTGELIYCFPNHGDGDQILNRRDFTNKIVMVDRGKVSFLKKIENILGLTTRDNGENVIHVSDINERVIEFTPGTSPFVLNSLGVGGILIVDDDDAESNVSVPPPVRGRSYGQSPGRDAPLRGCDEEFNFCHPLLGSTSLGGFAPQDSPKAWANVLVPVVLITKKSGTKLKSLMDATQSFIPGFGLQYLVNNNEGESAEDYQPRNTRDMYHRQEQLIDAEMDLGFEPEPEYTLPESIDHDSRIRNRIANLMRNRGR